MKLKDIIQNITSGGTPSTHNDKYYNGDIPWLRTQEVNFNFIKDTEMKITSDGLNNSSAKWIPSNSVIVAMYGNSAGRVAYSKIPLTTNQACCNITVDESKADSLFLYYYLVKNYSNLEKLANGGAQQNLNVGIIKDFPFPDVPLPEQHRISNILSSFDNKIEQLRKENNTLEDIAQSIFKEWFVKYNFPNKNGKPYRDNNGKMIDSELGLIPEGWRVGKLGEIFDFLEGPGIRNWQYATTGYPFINIRLLTDDHDIDIKNCNFISQEDALGKYKHFQLKEKDFVLSTSGTLGKYAIVRQNHLPLMLNTSVIRFRPKQDIPHSFLYLTLSSKRFLSELQSLAGGSVQLNFGPVHLKQINTLIPDNCTLKLFGNNLDRIYDKIANNKNRMIITKKTQNVLLKEILS